MTLASTARSAQWGARTGFAPGTRDTTGRQSVNIEFDREESCVWAFLDRNAPPHVSLKLLTEMGRLSESIRNGQYGSLRYRVISSRNATAFSLGGDLALFLDLIENRDEVGLLRYGKAAVDEIWANMSGCGLRDLTTVALVNGEAQGGGFEAALSCHILVAEAGTNFGFPEPLFGMFPGMGGFPLLRVRSDEGVARRIQEAGNRYTAEFLYEIGVIDYLASRGKGEQLVRALMQLETTGARAQNRKERLSAIPYQELVDSVEAWVKCALELTDKNRRSMAYLLNAQRKAYPVN